MPVADPLTVLLAGDGLGL